MSASSADVLRARIASYRHLSRGLAPPALCWHMACGHYLFVAAQRQLCPRFGGTPMPYARTLAGLMGGCVLAAFAAEGLLAGSAAGFALGTFGTLLNLLSFGVSYVQLSQAWWLHSLAPSYRHFLQRWWRRRQWRQWRLVSVFV